MLWHALISSWVYRLRPYRFVMFEHLSKPHRFAGSGQSTRFHFVHQPNWAFNVDANMGHRFAILTAHIGTLRTSCSGAS